MTTEEGIQKVVGFTERTPVSLKIVGAVLVTAVIAHQFLMAQFGTLSTDIEAVEKQQQTIRHGNEIIKIELARVQDQLRNATESRWTKRDMENWARHLQSANDGLDVPEVR